MLPVCSEPLSGLSRCSENPQETSESSDNDGMKASLSCGLGWAPPPPPQWLDVPRGEEKALIFGSCPAAWAGRPPPPPQWLEAPRGEEKALIFGSPMVWREGAWHTGGDWDVFQPPLGNFKDGDVLVNTDCMREFHIGGRAEINRRNLRI